MTARLVLDTNVLVAGLWSREGTSFQLLELIRAGRVEPALSVPLVLEYEMVLRRRASELELRSAEVDTLIDWLCAVGYHQRIHFLWRPTLRDPRDELVLELAVAAGCRLLVTFNTKDFVGAERLGVEPIFPAEALRRLGELR
jgi:putative PIN family toxin of toxin-antitoxin system